MVPPIRMLAAVATIMLCLLFTAKAQAQSYTTDACGNSVMMFDAATCSQSRSPLLGSVRHGLATFLECNAQAARQRQFARTTRRTQRRNSLLARNGC